MLYKRRDSARHQQCLETRSASSSSSTNMPLVAAAKSGSENIGASAVADVTATSSVQTKPVDNDNKVVICELLFFAINNMDKYPSEKVKEVITQFYREDEILAAKHTLIQEVSQAIKGLSMEKYVTRRIGMHKIKNTC